MARQWRQGAIDGGGFITAVAVDPFGSGTLLCGGDVSGVHRSENNGKRWTDRNGNRATVNGLKVACLKWHPTTPGLVYACIGLSGNGTWSGIYSSSDYGKTWSLLSGDVKFAANRNAAPGIPMPWPRSTGNLLEFVGTVMYAGTFKDGLKRSTDGGATWTTIALGTGPHYIRGITQDPAVPHRLFVATYLPGAGGVYRIDNADSGSPTVTQLTASPSEVEEVFAINGTVYAAAGAGIYSKPSNTADDAWTQRLSSGNKWTEIVGYQDGSNTVLYAGAYKGILGSGGKYANVMRSTDGGATWSDILQTATISFVSYERDVTWWLATSNPLSMFGAKRYTVTQIAVDPTNTQRLFVAGTHGLWVSEDGGATWRPALRELGATINQMIGVSGNNAIASDADWAFVRSNNLFLEQAGISGKEVPKDGYSIATDGTNWFVGSGDNKTTNLGGSMYVYSNFSTLSRDSKWDLAGATSSAQDLFDRTVTNGWGSAPLGGVWTAVSGANNRLSVAPGLAQIDTTQDNNLHQQQLNSVSLTDSYTETTIIFDRVPTGGWMEARVVVRADATATNFYAGVVRLEASGAITIYVRKFNGTTYIIAQSTVSDAYTPGTPIYVSVLMSNVTLTINAQLLSDIPEDVVSTSYTDDGTTRGPVIASGSPGLATTRQAGSSGAIVQFGLSEWQSPSDTGIAGAWPIGLACGTQSGNTMLVAAAQGKGIWRRNVTTNGNWTLATTAFSLTLPASRRLPITWSTVNGDTLWAFDLHVGVYRSTDYGQTWTLAWNATGDSDYYRGWIAADPTDGQVVWVVTDNGFYKVTNARSGSWTATPITVANSPGPMTVAPNGDVYIVDITDGPTNQPAIYRSTDHGTNWTNIADDTFRSVAIIPRCLAAKSDGTVLLATNGNGVLVYAPVATKQTIV